MDKNLNSIVNNEAIKQKEKTEKEKQNEKQKIIEHQKTKEEIRLKIDTDEKLFSLKELIDKWVISYETASNIIKWWDIDKDKIDEIFDKIDEIEEVKDIDKYLPKEIRISKTEYKKALEDNLQRVQTLTKLNTALTILAEQITWENIWWINLFSGFLAVLDKNLQKVQENTIDIKDSLEEVDKKQSPEKYNNKSVWQDIMAFFKDLFSK